jgi:hypothetical protein
VPVGESLTDDGVDYLGEWTDESVEEHAALLVTAIDRGVDAGDRW